MLLASVIPGLDSVAAEAVTAAPTATVAAGAGESSPAAVRPEGSDDGDGLPPAPLVAHDDNDMAAIYANDGGGYESDDAEFEDAMATQCAAWSNTSTVRGVAACAHTRGQLHAAALGRGVHS